MGLNLKMFDSLGMVTLVTPPSMLNPEKISFTLIYLKEKEKNQFAKAINELFPNDNVTVFIFDAIGMNNWLKQAVNKSKYVLLDKSKVPVWITELTPEEKTYHISETQTVEKTFKDIKEAMKN
jgi:hypothetical protein|tara:strand:- start:251 stop:619 length:369 start_codon:yes stop_codon:yes gene_type:complete